MPKYHIWTIGCQMNQAESERLGSLMEEHGYQPTAVAEEADCIVLNSCVVRQSAENRVVNKLDALRVLKQANPSLTIMVTGCLVNSHTDQLQKKYPHVDCFFNAGALPDLLVKPDVKTEALPLHTSPATFVPIMQGCDNFCSYCIVPFRRGREKSRPLTEITCEVGELVRRGVKEVTLLGQNVDSYGHDLSDKPDLADLLIELNSIKGLARIRFLTNHPKDISDKLIQTMARMDKVCEQLYLPVQSGDDDILKMMRRNYTAEHYRQLINRIRAAIPGIALNTDVIVGFPSETDEQFQHTYDLLAEIGFDVVHVAAYSPRPGTIAAREYKDDVPSAVKKERLGKIEQLQEKGVAEINSNLLGKTVEVLVEGKKREKWQGRTRTGKLVFFSSIDKYLGKLVEVKIEKTSPWALQGRVDKKL